MRIPTEASAVENPILAWLQSPELGWRWADARTVVREYRARRSDGVVDEREMLLLPILRDKLMELNPLAITDEERADRIIHHLRGLRDNEEWLAWLRNEHTFRFAVDEPAHEIRLVDYDTIDNNDFLATNQFRVEGLRKNIRTDILLFVNGVPLVNLEAKTTARDWHVDWTEGVKQTRRYLEQTPQLYASNLFCAAANELVLKYGIPGEKVQDWHQWRDPGPHHHIDAGHAMQCSVYGLFDRRNLLDLLQNFAVFEVIEGKAVKKVARYQQFRAANELVERSLQLEQPAGWRRGIVWHSQGSGKSLTILFGAKKLWNHQDMQQPTVLVVVDRDQLQDQMIRQVVRTNTHNTRIAASKRELLDLLRDDFRGIIITIMHKFTPGDRFQLRRRNVVALVDEAHRSQEGEFGTWMRATLPEAALFGFTGTPIENNDHNTPFAFGQVQGRDANGDDIIERYMDRYSNADAIRDGATLPIHYETRLSDWAIWGERLDKVFEREFARLSPGEREQLKRESATLEAVVKLPKRIELIARDVADDFRSRVRPLGFKAMLVCYDKETCALYKAAFDALLTPEATLCIFSEDPEKDKEIVKAHYLGDRLRRQAIDDFIKTPVVDGDEHVKPENRFRNAEIVIVCDMLLTGFDAPIVQTMYLDKGLRDHGLLQAIARVNRPYTEFKQHGIIIDYFGIFDNLNAALNFDRNELGVVAFPYAQLRTQFLNEISTLRNLLQPFPREGDYDAIMAIVTWFNVHETERAQFEISYRALNLLWETLQPDPFLIDYNLEYVWLSWVARYVRKQFYPQPQQYETAPVDGAKTRAMIQEYVDPDELYIASPVYVLDANYLTNIKETPPDAKALNIEAMLAAELKVRIDEDEDFVPLSERLKHIIERKRQGALIGLSLLQQLEQLAREVIDLIQESRRPLAESIARLAQSRANGLTALAASRVAAAVLAVADELCFPGWNEQDYMDTDLFREITVMLVQQFPASRLHTADQDFVTRCIKLLRKSASQGPA